MTRRERLQTIFQHKALPTLAWTTLVDGNTLGGLPASMQGMSVLDFYNYLGCDVLDLNAWALPWYFSGVRLITPGVEVVRSVDDAGNQVEETRCARGVLRARVSSNWHPIEYQVKSYDDLRLFLHRWESSYYEAVDDTQAYANVEQLVGDAGVSVLFPQPSAIPYLLENAIGMEQFYYLLDDYPDEMDALIRTIQARDHQRFLLQAQHPCPTAILCENTSSRYISPAIYARYNMPSQRDFVETMHAAGKTAILHMCGHIHNLLPLIKETGADGIHAMTPPPLGDCPWEAALDVLGDELIIFGTLNPDIFHDLPADEVGPALDRLITPRVAASPFVLTLFADGITVPLERFLLVKDWVERRAAM